MNGALYLISLLVITDPTLAQLHEARRHFNQANDYVVVGEYEYAIEEFQQTYLSDSRQVGAIYNIARCYERLADAGEPNEQALVHKHRAIDAYRNYLDVSRHVPSKAPFRDKAVASISRLKLDINRIETERAPTQQRSKELEEERERDAQERKMLEEKVNQMLARDQETQRQWGNLHERHRRSRLKWGASLAGAGLALAGLGAGLLGKGEAIFAEAKAISVYDIEAAFNRRAPARSFDLAGGILMATGATAATLGILRFTGAVRSGHGSAVWLAASAREFAVGGAF